MTTRKDLLNLENKHSTRRYERIRETLLNFENKLPVRVGMPITPGTTYITARQDYDIGTDERRIEKGLGKGLAY